METLYTTQQLLDMIENGTGDEAYEAYSYARTAYYSLTDEDLEECPWISEDWRSIMQAFQDARCS